MTLRWTNCAREDRNAAALTERKDATSPVATPKRNTRTALRWIWGLSLIIAVPSFAAEGNSPSAAMNSIRVTIGKKVFTARLHENATASAFRAMLPLTLRMRDLNDNEKVVDLPETLPGKVSNPGTIQTGDLMIWSGRSLVLFYKTFPTQYSYATVGRIQDPTGLAEAVGVGTATVTFDQPQDTIQPR